VDLLARAELTFAEAGFAVEMHVREGDRRSRSSPWAANPMPTCSSSARAGCDA
jgi:hypothetical protein